MVTRRILLKSALALPLASPLLAKRAQSSAESSAESGVESEENWLEVIARQLRDEFKVPAVWLATAIDEDVNAVAVGVRKTGDATAATTGDLLTVASVSKPMAGLWIATLVEKGKLKYTSKLLDILPELADVCLPEHREITLEQLLTHTAGVARTISNLPSGLALNQYPDERIRQGKILLKAPAPAGSVGRESYSNNGFALAVAMAERVAGEAYEVAATRFYHDELGLQSWGVWDKGMPNDLSQPWPHGMKDGVLTAYRPRSVEFEFTRPGGSAHCTVADMARFGLMATNAWPQTSRILKLSTWDSLLARVPKSSRSRGSFALALNKETYLHSGALLTTRSDLQVIPSWRVAVAVHTNADCEPLIEVAADRVLDAIRLQYAQVDPPPPCRITLTGIDTMDETWLHVITPKTTDDQLRVRIAVQVEAAERCGDLKTTFQVGDVKRIDNRFNGLAAAPRHYLYFAFDTPKEKVSPTVLIIDALGTAGNIAPETARFESSLTLE